MKNVLTLLFFFFIAEASAQDALTFGDFNLKGTGCKEGTYSISTSPDLGAVAILFDEFRAEVPQYSNDNDNADIRGTLGAGLRNEAIDHKACNIGFNANLGKGQRIEAVELTLQIRGNTMLDKGIEATYSSILVGMRNAVLIPGASPVQVIERKLWRASDVNEDWITDKVVTVPVKSNCNSNGNQKVKFDIKNHLTIKIPTNDLTKNGMVTIDSQDMTGALKIRVITANCEANSTPGNGNGRGNPPRPHPRGR